MDSLGIFGNAEIPVDENLFGYDENGYPASLDINPEDINPLTDFTFELNTNGDGYILIAYNGARANVVIPKTYEGLPVTAIDDYAFASWSIPQPLTSVAIPNSVNAIGYGAFDGSGLSTVIIPGSVIELKGGAFDGENLTWVQFLGDVPSNLGTYIFSDNPRLTPRTILVSDAQLEAYKTIARSNFDVYSTVIYSLGSPAPTPTPLDGSGYPAELNINPADVNPESDFWFSWDSVLGGWEISGYEGVGTDVVIPKTRASDGELIVKIAESAFYHKDLTSVAIPNSIKVIDSYTFGSNWLSTLVVPDSVYFIGEWAFKDNSLTSLKLPINTTVDPSAFNQNFLPDSKAYIYTNGSDTQRLVSYGGASKSAVVPSGTRIIDDGAFVDNEITSVIIPNSVVSIGRWAFQNNLLTSVDLPDGLLYLGERSFQYNELTSIDIPEGITTIGSSAFEYNRMTSVTLPSTINAVGEGAFNWNQLPESQAYFYSDMQNKIRLSSYGGDSFHPVIPAGTEIIASYTFRDKYILSVGLPSSLKTIENHAFFRNNLTSLTLPEGLTWVGTSAFQYNQLSSLIIPSTVTTINGSAFSNNSLTTLRFNGARPSMGNTPFSGQPPFAAGTVFVPSAYLNSYRSPSSRMTAINAVYASFVGY